MRPIDKVLQALDKLNKAYSQKSGYWLASSPLRADKHPSMALYEKPDGTVFIKDFGGGETEDILAALGLEFADLFPNRVPKNTGINLNQPDAIYSYRNAQGVEVCQVLRFEIIDNGLPVKTFRQRHMFNGKWVWKAPPQPPLYRLPDLLGAHPDLWVFIPEGEKDVDNLYDVGLVATTNIGGSNRQWTDDYVQMLAGRMVCLLADNDKPGLERVRRLAAQLDPVVKELKIVTPAMMQIEHIPGGDVSDALLLGFVSGFDLEQLANNAPPYVAQQTGLYAASKQWTLTELMETGFPPLKWIIPNLIPEGMTLLAAKQKTGKGWLLLNWLVEIATGGQVWGNDVEPRKCLLISLEDSPELVQERYRKLGHSTADQLILQFERPDVFSQDGLARLEEEIIREEYGLVVIDTFSRAALTVDQKQMHEVMPIVDAIQNIAKVNRMSILISDHLRKSVGGVRDDMYDVFGSIVKTLTADTVINLERDKDDFGTIAIKGRRHAEEQEFAIKFNRATGYWELLGHLQTFKKQQKYDEIIQAIQALGGSANKDEIADYMGKDASGVNRILVSATNDGVLIRQKDPNKSNGFVYHVL